MAIKENIALRATVEILLALIAEEVSEHSDPAFARLLLEGLREIIPPAAWPQPTQVRDVPLSETMARSFDERRLMPFGQHAGTPIGEVPIAYLCWLEEQPDFRRELKAYLRSERGQLRQDE